MLCQSCGLYMSHSVPKEIDVHYGKISWAETSCSAQTLELSAQPILSSVRSVHNTRLTLKIVATWMLRVTFYSVGIFRTSSPGDSISSNPERSAPRRLGEESGYIEVCYKGQVVWTSKAFLWIKKTRYLKLRNLALFYIWEDTKVWAHWNRSLHVHLSYLGPVSCDFSHPKFLSAHRREWLQLMAARSCRYSSPSWVPWRAGIADDCDIPAYCNGRKYSLS